MPRLRHEASVPEGKLVSAPKVEVPEVRDDGCDGSLDSRVHELLGNAQQARSYVRTVRLDQPIPRSGVALACLSLEQRDLRAVGRLRGTLLREDCCAQLVLGSLISRRGASPKLLESLLREHVYRLPRGACGFG